MGAKLCVSPQTVYKRASQQFWRWVRARHSGNKIIRFAADHLQKNLPTVVALHAGEAMWEQNGSFRRRPFIKEPPNSLLRCVAGGTVGAKLCVSLQTIYKMAAQQAFRCVRVGHRVNKVVRLAADHL